MKICDEGTEEERVLRYKDLKVGDVFKWLEERPYGHGPCLRYVNFRYVYLESMKDFSEGKDCSKKVTRYPNACISLGDPE